MVDFKRWPSLLYSRWYPDGRVPEGSGPLPLRGNRTQSGKKGRRTKKGDRPKRRGKEVGNKGEDRAQRRKGRTGLKRGGGDWDTNNQTGTLPDGLRRLKQVRYLVWLSSIAAIIISYQWSKTNFVVEKVFCGILSENCSWWDTEWNGGAFLAEALIFPLSASIQRVIQGVDFCLSSLSAFCIDWIWKC